MNEPKKINFWNFYSLVLICQYSVKSAKSKVAIDKHDFTFENILNTNLLQNKICFYIANMVMRDAYVNFDKVKMTLGLDFMGKNVQS